MASSDCATVCGHVDGRAGLLSTCDGCREAVRERETVNRMVNPHRKTNKQKRINYKLENDKQETNRLVDIIETDHLKSYLHYYTVCILLTDIFTHILDVDKFQQLARH